MDLPFNVQIKTYRYDHDQLAYMRIKDITFSDDEKLLENGDIFIPEYMENKPIVIDFKSDDVNARLSIAGLETYYIGGRLNSDDAEFSPNGENIYLYSYGGKGEPAQTVPLIPGIYTVTVILQQVKYYGHFKVIPTNLSDEDWQIMRDEVNDMSEGLAVDFIKSKREQDGYEFTNAITNINSKARLDSFIDNRKKIRYVLETLRHQAKYQIKKSYSWVEPGLENNIDAISMRASGRHPEKRGLVYASRKYLDYDVVENRWVKRILSEFIHYVRSGINYYNELKQKELNHYESKQSYLESDKIEYNEKYHNMHSHANKIADFDANISILEEMQNYFVSMSQDDFLVQLTNTKQMPIPKALILSPKYNYLYKQYLNVTKKDADIKLDSRLTYFWKRTDTLYEIWTYIKTLKIFIDEGYSPISGWIYDLEYQEQLPFLESGTQIILERANISIVITFDKELPDAADKTDFLNPLYTESSRNKPDIRVDVIVDKDKYIGSVLMDAKYKNFQNIRGSNYNRQQFREYKNDPQAPNLAFPERFKKRYTPVSAVIVLSPKNSDVNVDTNFDGDEQLSKDIYMNLLNPSNGESSYSKTLLDEISGIIELYNDYGITNN